MQAILAHTAEVCHEKMAAYDLRLERTGSGPSSSDDGGDGEAEKKRHLALMNASEVKVVRFARELREPGGLEKFAPREVKEGGGVDESVGEKRPDALDVLHLGVGKEGEGAMQVLTEGTQGRVVEGGEAGDKASEDS